MNLSNLFVLCSVIAHFNPNYLANNKYFNTMKMKYKTYHIIYNLTRIMYIYDCLYNLIVHCLNVLLSLNLSKKKKLTLNMYLT